MLQATSLIERNTIEVTIEFTSPMLGTAPKNADIYSRHIQTKAKALDPDKIAEELETVGDMEKKGWTGFHSDEKGLFIYDYMIRGFIKASIEILQANGMIKKIPAYKKWGDCLIFVYPRRIYFDKTEPDGVLERPLRAMTPAGPRVALNKSDYINEGTQLTFKIIVLKNTKMLTIPLIVNCLEYGQFCGLGQWRGSGGYGQFKVISITDTD